MPSSGGRPEQMLALAYRAFFAPQDRAIRAFSSWRLDRASNEQRRSRCGARVPRPADRPRPRESGALHAARRSRRVPRRRSSRRLSLVGGGDAAAARRCCSCAGSGWSNGSAQRDPLPVHRRGCIRAEVADRLGDLLRGGERRKVLVRRLVAHRRRHDRAHDDDVRGRARSAEPVGECQRPRLCRCLRRRIGAFVCVGFCPDCSRRSRSGRVRSRSDAARMPVSRAGRCGRADRSGSPNPRVVPPRSAFPRANHPPGGRGRRRDRDARRCRQPKSAPSWRRAGRRTRCQPRCRAPRREHPAVPSLCHRARGLPRAKQVVGRPRGRDSRRRLRRRSPGLRETPSSLHATNANASTFALPLG